MDKRERERVLCASLSLSRSLSLSLSLSLLLSFYVTDITKRNFYSSDKRRSMNETLCFVTKHWLIACLCLWLSWHLCEVEHSSQVSSHRSFTHFLLAITSFRLFLAVAVPRPSVFVTSQPDDVTHTAAANQSRIQWGPARSLITFLAAIQASG